MNLSLSNGLYCTKLAHFYLRLRELLHEQNSSKMGSVPIFLNFSSNNSLRNSSRVINHRCELTIKQSHLRSHVDQKEDSITKTSNNGIDINPKRSPGQHHEENGWKVKLKTKVFLVLESSQKFEIVSEGFTKLPRHKHSNPRLKF